MTDATLQELVERLDTFGDRRAVGLRRSHAARWWSYRRLQTETLRFAAELAEHGIGRGDRVLLWGANSPEWAAAALGALVRGAVVVPVDADASEARASATAELAAARLVLHDPGLDAPGLGPPCVPLVARSASAALSEVLVRVGASDPAFVLFTSGSTREPRGVVLTHGNLVSQLGAFRKWRRLTRLHGFRLLALSPLSHVQGLLMGLFVPLSVGVNVLYSDSVEPVHVMRTLRQNRVHLLLAVPRVQGMLADALRNAPHGRSGRTLAERAREIGFFPLRRHVLFTATRRRLGYWFNVLLVGGATLPADDERFWYECGYILVQGYGLTETSALVSVRTNVPFGARLGSVGRALPHQEVHIGEGGEVLVRGPNVAETNGGDGYLHTGDLGRLDTRGRLWLHGRKDDVIVTAEGLNVHAGDVEARLRSVAGVRDAVVADPGRRGQAHAVLLLENGASAEAAVAAANVRLEPHQRVYSWSVWPEADFPRTSLQKVRRAEVAAAAASGSPPRDEPRPDLVTIRREGDRRRRLELLARYVTAPGHAVEDGDARVEDFDLSSLDAVELTTLLETHLGPVQHAPVTPATTIAELRTSLLKGGAARPPSPTHQPRWSGALPGRTLRFVTRAPLVGGWSRVAARVSAAGCPPRGQCIYAVAPHRHWLDAFAVQAALPRRTRTITVTNRDFAEHFAPSADVPRRTRVSVGLAYYVLWPLVFEFAIVPNFGSTREGLQELGRAIDRGVSPISFPKGLVPPGAPNARHETGVAVLAAQTETPVVPVWLEGNDDLHVIPRGGRPSIRVWFGDAVAVGPRTSAREVVERIEAAYAALAATAAGVR